MFLLVAAFHEKPGEIGTDKADYVPFSLGLTTFAKYSPTLGHLGRTLVVLTTIAYYPGGRSQ